MWLNDAEHRKWCERYSAWHNVPNDIWFGAWDGVYYSVRYYVWCDVWYRAWYGVANDVCSGTWFGKWHHMWYDTYHNIWAPLNEEIKNHVDT